MILSLAKFISKILYAASVIGIAWVVGLLIFIETINAYQEPQIDETLKPAQAIVVLTGGSERLTTGLALLKAGKGQKLLVSGVPTGLTIEKIMAKENVPQHLRDCCITLGHSAADTLGNAEETKLWIENENFHSLRLVTANYHMPRSLVLLQEAMPDIEIIPHPVVPSSVKLSHWWTWPGSATLLANEYDKYLFAVFAAAIENINRK